MRAINQSELRLLLKQRAKKAGSERKLAEKLSVSYAYMLSLIHI